jgi:large subunit ribosomal protein L18
MITAKYSIKKIKAKRLRNALKAKIRGTQARPRLILVKSNKYLYTQVIDDASHQVLTTASTLERI